MSKRCGLPRGSVLAGMLFVCVASASACGGNDETAPGDDGTAGSRGGSAGNGGSAAGGQGGTGAVSAGSGFGASGGKAGNGGNSGSGSGKAGNGGAGVSGGGAGRGGTEGSSAAETGGAGMGGAGSPPVGACGVTEARIRITEVNLGANVVHNEDEAALMPLVISPKASGGARLAWMGDDDRVHVSELDADDQLTGNAISLPAHDFSDLYADDAGGTLLLTRDAEGGGTLNCGAPTNLCGNPPNPPVPCYDMYMVRFDGESESWATKLTDSSSALPPYSTAPDGDTVYMIWWYAHHGRIAFDGSRYAGYFGSAISVSQGGCINIHQGDRMQIVDGAGELVSGGFPWGCSHSGYERIVWDPTANEFVSVCKTDNDNRIAFPRDYTTIRPVDLAYSNLGNLVTAVGGGYFLITSDIREGQPPGADGLADVRLLHFTDGAADSDVVLKSEDGLNVRAPHLAAYGAERMIAAWETTTRTGDIRASDTNRQLYVQTLSRSTGAPEGDPLPVNVRGNRYQDFAAFPDGSVAFVAPGSIESSVKILRVLGCSE